MIRNPKHKFLMDQSSLGRFINTPFTLSVDETEQVNRQRKKRRQETVKTINLEIWSDSPTKKRLESLHSISESTVVGRIINGIFTWEFACSGLLAHVLWSNWEGGRGQASSKQTIHTTYSDHRQPLDSWITRHAHRGSMGMGRARYVACNCTVAYPLGVCQYLAGLFREVSQLSDVMKLNPLLGYDAFVWT